MNEGLVAPQDIDSMIEDKVLENEDIPQRNKKEEDQKMHKYLDQILMN